MPNPMTGRDAASMRAWPHQVPGVSRTRSIRSATTPTTTTCTTVPTPGITLRSAAAARNTMLTRMFAAPNARSVRRTTPFTSVENPSEPRSAVSTRATPHPSVVLPITSSSERRSVEVTYATYGGPPPRPLRGRTAQSCTPGSWAPCECISNWIVECSTS